MASRGAKTNRPRGPAAPPLSWDDLRTALFLAREGSIRRAARALGVSHSTVLRRLAHLERDAGVRLFEKKPDGYELTPAGQDVFDTARDLAELVTGLERRVQGRDLRLSGAVRITLPDFFFHLLAPAFAELARVHPEIEVTLGLGAAYADLAHREADIAVRVATSPPPDLVGRRVAHAMAGIYGSADYLRGRKTNDLAALDWIGWEPSSQMAFAQWTARNVPASRVRLRLDDGWAFRDAIDAGAGVAVVPCALGEPIKSWKRIRLLPELGTPLWILTHKDLRTTARVRVLRDFLADALTVRRALVEGK